VSPYLPKGSVRACLPSLPEDVQFSLTKETRLVLGDNKVSRIPFG
jgi:hypothetical protein